MKRLILLLSLLAALFTVGCDPHPRRRSVKRPPQHPTKQIEVHHLKDGRYVYRDDLGNLWFYMWIIQNSPAPSYYSTTANVGLPRGGGWTMATNVLAETAEEIVAQIADTPGASTTVAFNEGTGQLLSPTEVQVETQMEFDFMAEGGPGIDSTAGEAGAASDSGSADSGSSDAGGGADSGGGDAGGSPVCDFRLTPSSLCA